MRQRRGFRGWGPWSGHGQFSHLPPWERPGWLFGRGACWWLYNPYLRTGIAPKARPTSLAGISLTQEQEIEVLEQQAKAIEAQLEATRRTLEDMKKGTTSERYYPPYGHPSTEFGYPPEPYVTPSPDEELASLEDYRRALDEEVKGVEARIEELRKILEKKSKK